MDRTASTKLDVLESMLVDESLKPTDLPLSLLEYITNSFSDDKQIGRGGFAVVYKGILRNGTVAVKKMFNMHLHEKKFQQEVECLMKAKHKNVVRFLGYCSDTQGKMENYNGKLVMADVPQRLLCFEYLPKGSLHEYIIDGYGELKWTQCYEIIKGICTGLDYLHENHIVHLDFKPANILLDNNMVPKIADFGLSRCFDENQSHASTSKLFGSLGYLAPEVYCGRISFKSDLYSLGVIMIEILTRERMYPEDFDVLKNWGNRLETPHREKQLEQLHLCAEIGKECTDYDPRRRPDARTIIRRLREADIADISFVSDMSNLSITQEEQHGDGRLKYWIYFLRDFEKLNAYDLDCRRWIQVPEIVKDAFPRDGYKESLAVGRDLLVFFKGNGEEHIQLCHLRYSMEANSWYWAAPMNCPRSLFGSASVGHKAYLAGGIDCYGTFLSSVQTYDCVERRWGPLPSMNRARMMCSGVFMDRKLYVIGGKGSNNEELTCGEEYDFELGSWRVIEKITEGLNVRVKSFRVPPLVAVVNNELYGADYIENKVKKYDKKNNRWITLGSWPGSIIPSSSITKKKRKTNALDIGFKACGDKLIIIVGPTSSILGNLKLYSWVPDGGPPVWNLIAGKRSSTGSVYHAAVMSF